MVSAEKFVNYLIDRGVSFFTGVPDSLLKDFCACLHARLDKSHHIIAANEGNAVALAAGHYLGTGRTGVVYLQNSGLGNAINPLLSLNDPGVYGVPVLLVIGWRGEPGFKDEPQHLTQGKITTQLLEVMEIPFYVICATTLDYASLIDTALKDASERRGPVALLVRKNAFQPYRLSRENGFAYPLSREQAIGCLIDTIGKLDILVATTGMISRELYELRSARGDTHACDFLTVGSMGHALSISFGLALAQPSRRIICLDGDGSLLMHMGSLAIIGQSQPENLVHVVLNNGAHDSVGGQPTCGFDVDITSIALGCGYRNAKMVSEPVKIKKEVSAMLTKDGPSFLEIRVAKGARDDLGRPKSKPGGNRDALMLGLGIIDR
jgi:phosphonopyruvate decarboxylase